MNFNDIKNIVYEAKNIKNCTHVMIIRDNFSYTYYPLYVYNNDNVKELFVENSTNMHEVKEVYNLSQSLEEQLSRYRNISF